MEEDYVHAEKPDVGYEHEDGFDVQYEEMFADRRLSQIVADILDSDSNIGIPDCLTADSEDDESIITDFIEYNEEPKNKELFRDATRVIKTQTLFLEDEPASNAIELGDAKVSNDTNNHTFCDSLTDIKDKDEPLHLQTARETEINTCNDSESNERVCETEVGQRCVDAENVSETEVGQRCVNADTEVGQRCVDAGNVSEAESLSNIENLPATRIVNIEESILNERLMYIDEDSDDPAAQEERDLEVERNDIVATDIDISESADKHETLLDGSETESPELDKPITRWSVTSV